jgi:hypothetical protein
MVHLRAVISARGAGDLARFDAGAQLCARESFVGAREAGNDPRGRETDIGAVVAIADATDHLGDVRLGETRIRAGVARFGARVTGGDALDRDGAIR